MIFDNLRQRIAMVPPLLLLTVATSCGDVDDSAARLQNDTPTTKQVVADSDTPTTSNATDVVDTNDVFDPGPLDGKLKKYVANGKVDYAGFKSDPEFASIVSAIETADPDAMASDDERLAFWINAYNVIVIKNVNANPGIAQPLDVDGFFDKVKFTVAGKQLTLNDIENTIIRPTFKEPLIHFGLVCAARSCPPLIATAYTAENVRSQLAANARAYLADAAQNKYVKGTKTLSLSKIFEWYKIDFGNDDAGLIAFAKQYGPEAMVAGLGDGRGVKVKFLEYDWTLNKK